MGRVLKEELERSRDSGCLCQCEAVAIHKDRGQDGLFSIDLRMLQGGGGAAVATLPVRAGLWTVLPDRGLIRVRAKRVVIATGGRQRLPESLPPPLTGWEQKVVLSDAVLKNTNDLAERMRRCGGGWEGRLTSRGQGRPPTHVTALHVHCCRSQARRVGSKASRLVIVGSSHSGFSVAWLCLHRMDTTLFSDPASVSILVRGAVKVMSRHFSP